MISAILLVNNRKLTWSRRLAQIQSYLKYSCVYHLIKVGLVVYPMSGNNTTLKINFTDLAEKKSTFLTLSPSEILKICEKVALETCILINLFTKTLPKILCD